MRLSLLFLILLFILSACSSLRTYPPPNKNKLTTFYFPERGGKLDLFFSGESEPDQDYLRLCILKESKLAHKPNIGALLESLKGRALRAGADALIVMGTNDFEDIRSASADDIRTTPRENMWGIAIRYLDNIEPQSDLLSHLVITTHGSIAEQGGGEIEISEYGEFANPTPNTWAEYAYYHSLNYLLENEEDWWHGQGLRNGPYGEFTLIRQLGLGIKTKTKLTARIDGENRIEFIKIRQLNGKVASIKMDVSYNQENQVTGWSWEEVGGPIVQVKRSYHENGNVYQDAYIQEVAAYEEVADTILIATYNYLSKEDFLRKLNAEQIVRVKP